MIITKRAEKVLIWMHRTGFNGQIIAEKSSITRQAFNAQFKNDNFSETVINTMKSLGFRE